MSRRTWWPGIVLTVLWTGCDIENAENVALRYQMERELHRAGLARYELEQAAGIDTTAWKSLAARYNFVVVGLGVKRITQRSEDVVESQLAKLTLRGLLKRAEALSYSGERLLARIDYQTVLNQSVYPGSRAEAALGLAVNEDRNDDWEAAYEAYHEWLEGVRRGDWPLRKRALEIPTYVSRRLADRGQPGERRSWVEKASDTLEEAARRDEHARQARYMRFVLLLDANRWDAAHSALKRTRRIYDPEGKDGDFALAEASLLAKGLGRSRDALSILANLQRFEIDNVEHRVAAALLAGQIHAEAGRLHQALQSYERALELTRSSMGRSEATLGLARTHVQSGNLDLARRHYSQLRELYPSTPAGLLAPLEEYRLLQENQMHREAKAVLRQSVQHYRRTIHFFGTELPALRAATYLSEVFGLSESWEHGVAFLDSVASSFENDPRAGSLLLRAARLSVDELQDPEKAHGFLQLVHRRYPNSDLSVAVRSLTDSLAASVTP